MEACSETQTGNEQMYGVQAKQCFHVKGRHKSELQRNLEADQEEKTEGSAS